MMVLENASTAFVLPPLPPPSCICSNKSHDDKTRHGKDSNNVLLLIGHFSSRERWERSNIFLSLSLTACCFSFRSPCLNHSSRIVVVVCFEFFSTRFKFLKRHYALACSQSHCFWGSFLFADLSVLPWSLVPQDNDWQFQFFKNGMK
jgi:hypothetical protein